MSFAIKTETRGLERASKVLIKLSFLDTVKLANGVGAMIESQTQRRISKQEGPPDDSRWAPYSPGYKQWKDRKKGTGKGVGFLRLEGHLLQSIQHVATSSGEEIGSNLIYAATQQLGSRDGTVPDRPYLGISRENDDDIEDLVDKFIETEIGI